MRWRPLGIRIYAGTEPSLRRQNGPVDLDTRAALYSYIASGSADRPMRHRFGVPPRARGG